MYTFFILSDQTYWNLFYTLRHCLHNILQFFHAKFTENKSLIEFATWEKRICCQKLFGVSSEHQILLQVSLIIFFWELLVAVSIYSEKFHWNNCLCIKQGSNQIKCKFDIYIYFNSRFLSSEETLFLPFSRIRPWKKDVAVSGFWSLNSSQAQVTF